MYSNRYLIEEVPRKLILPQVREHGDPLHLGREWDEHFEEDEAEGVDVHLVAVRPPAALLGAHVQLGAHLIGVLPGHAVAAVIDGIVILASGHGW